MPEPEISVVVPVRDGARALPALTRALGRQTLAAERFELVVVDNASRDSSGALASAAGARVVYEPTPGRARARNRGVEAAAAPLIAFTDADCVPQPGWLAALLGCLEHAPMVAGEVSLLVGAPPNRWERLESLWRFQQERNVLDGWAATANLGVRREVLAGAGGFDASYRHIGEDVDLCLRARAAGYALAWCPEAIVDHAAESSAVAVLRRAAVHGYSSNQHAHRWPGRIGRRHWRHPLPALAGDWALRRFGVDPAAHADLLRVARLEYACRVIGSAWAELRRAR
jgi:GT2 family glycosyltransferase